MSLVNKIGLGTVQFGLQYGISNNQGKTTSLEVEEILNYASVCGINTLDTASVYGSSEEVLGGNDLSNFQVVSKFIVKEDTPPLSLQLSKSLDLLNIETLYGYIAHRPLDVVRTPELWYELKECKRKGQIQKMGFSFNEINEVEAVLSRGFVPDIVQVPYNYLDSRFEKYMIDLKEEGCEIHTRSAFLQGLFFMDMNSLGPFFEEIKPIVTQLQGYDEKLPGMLLKYCIEKPFIDKVIFGVNNLYQLKKNIAGIEHSSILPPVKEKISESLLIPSQWQV